MSDNEFPPKYTDVIIKLRKFLLSNSIRVFDLIMID